MNFDRKLHALQAEYLKAEAEVARLQNLINRLTAELSEIKPEVRTRRVLYYEFDSVVKFNRFIKDKEISLEKDEDGDILIVYRGAESEEEIARRRAHFERRIDGIRGRSLRIQQEKLEKLKKQLEENEA